MGTSLTVDELVAWAIDFESGYRVDFGNIPLSEKEVFTLFAAHVITMTEGMRYDEQVKILSAAVTVLLAENFLMHLMTGDSLVGN